MKNLEQTWRSILDEFHQQANLREGHIVVIGCSTSEVAGRRIGTSGSEQIAEAVYKGLEEPQGQNRNRPRFSVLRTFKQGVGCRGRNGESIPSSRCFRHSCPESGGIDGFICL